jgi:hypothetical protein
MPSVLARTNKFLAEEDRDRKKRLEIEIVAFFSALMIAALDGPRPVGASRIRRCRYFAAQASASSTRSVGVRWRIGEARSRFRAQGDNRPRCTGKKNF